MPKKENKLKFTEEILSGIIRLAGYLVNIEKIEKILGLEKGSIEQYAKSSSEFTGKLENASLQLDLDVEMAIYKRAVGYETTEKHEVYTAVYYDNDDKPVLRLKEVKYVTKSVPPETSSGLTWLYNKQGDKWSKNPAVSNELSNKEIEILKKRASEIAQNYI